MLEKKKRFDFDAAGWGFFLVVFALLVAPGIYLSWQLVGQWASRAYPIIMGIALAALGAGFVSWGVNAFLQNRIKKAKLAGRKQAKKKK